MTLGLYKMTLALFLDVIIAFLLAGTIYFVWQLSERLQRFRQNRQEIERVVRDLNDAIVRAGQATQGLRQTAEGIGQDLQKSINQATELSDELQLVTEAANNLATRLERASDQGPGRNQAPPSPPSSVRADIGPAQANSSDRPTFAIRDAEYDARRGGTASDDDHAQMWDDDIESKSQAEIDLMRALQGQKKSSATSRSV